MKRLEGLDTLRAVLALTVVACHIYMMDVWSDSPLGFIANKIYSLLSFGPGAVLCFFVVSGFCIHYGNVETHFNLRAFYTRRYIRTIVPLSAAVFIAWLLDLSYWPASSITWSLLCEELYYLAYPYFRNVSFRRWGLARTALIMAAFGYVTLLIVPAKRYLERVPLGDRLFSGVAIGMRIGRLVSQDRRAFAGHVAN
jgi:peptidoglycan/LPS O-acetylase OafA/YrhL